MLTLDMICQAQHRLRGRVHRTPLVYSAALSAHLGARVHLKVECLQKTGSFKPRGAFNKMLSLSAEQRQRGVVTFSGGNHAQGVAYAARQLGIAATIAMPASTPRNYLDATRGYGADVVLTPDIRAAFAEVDRFKAQGRVVVHPFDDPLVAAGQGTVGLEILEDLPTVRRVYVSIGGGGLITGVGSAIKALKPEIRLWGAEPETGAPAARSFAMGAPQAFKEWTASFVDGAGGKSVFPRMWQRMQPLVDGCIVVSLEETKRAMRIMADKARIISEGAGALPLAAALTGKAGQGPIVAIVSGGNIDLKQFSELVGSAAGLLP